jgi:putative transcriptional regulator
MAISIKERERRKKIKFLEDLGKHIKALRISKGINGAELGRRLFMERSHIARLEMGRVNPSVYLINEICEALNISLKEFWKDFKST